MLCTEINGNCGDGLETVLKNMNISEDQLVPLMKCIMKEEGNVSLLCSLCFEYGHGFMHILRYWTNTHTTGIIPTDGIKRERLSYIRNALPVSWKVFWWYLTLWCDNCRWPTPRGVTWIPVTHIDRKLILVFLSSCISSSCLIISPASNKCIFFIFLCLSKNSLIWLNYVLQSRFELCYWRFEEKLSRITQLCRRCRIAVHIPVGFYTSANQP